MHIISICVCFFVLWGIEVNLFFCQDTYYQLNNLFRQAAFEMAFIGHPQLPSLGEAGDGKSADMNKLGKVISRLLRAHTYVQKQGGRINSVIGP